ncbi:MAG: beta-propeller fold lactonase family protein [Planctomycetota bacterium]
MLVFLIPIWAVLAATESPPAGPEPTLSASDEAEAEAVVATWTRPRPVAPGPLGIGGTLGFTPEVTFVSANDEPEGDMPRNVVFTPDGSAAVIVNRDTDTLTFFDIQTQTITHTVAIGDFPVDVAVTPDGRYAVSPNVLGNTVSVVDIASHTVAAHVPMTGDQPFRVAVTSDSSFAVVAVINDGVQSAFSVIDLDTLTETLSFPTTGQGVIGFFFTPESGINGNIFSQFALSPDDTTIVLPDGAGDRVMLYDRNSGAELADLATDPGPRAVDVSADGAMAVVSHEGATRRITEVDLVNQIVADVWTTGDNLTGQIIRVTPDKSHAIAAISNNVIFVNLDTGVTTATLFTGVVGDIEISFDGQFAFVSNFNARVIDIGTRTIVRTISFAPCAESATSPVERRAVALNNRFREDIHLYDINGAGGFFEGRALTGEPPEGDATRTLAISPDDTTLVAANNTSRNVSIVNVASGSVRAYVDTGDRPLGVAIASDGVTAVVCNGDQNTVSVIDLTTDTEVANLSVFSRPAEVVISPDGQTAYITSIQGADRLHFINLDGPDSSVLGSIPTGQMGSIIYTYNVVSGMAVSPDGSVLALCLSFDDELQLVDAINQSEIIRVPVGDFPIRVVFAPDGQHAYVVHSFSDDLYVVTIDGINSNVEAIVPGIDFPLIVNVDDTDSFVYVGSFGAPSIKVVDTSLPAVVQTVGLTNAPRAAHLSSLKAILYVATTGAELVRLSAAGPASVLIDSNPLSAGPSDLVFAESRNMAVAAQPIPDGVDLVRFGPPGDLNGDGTVGISDLLILLGSWGPCPPPSDPCPADLNGDGFVGIADLLMLLANWG